MKAAAQRFSQRPFICSPLILYLHPGRQPFCGWSTVAQIPSWSLADLLGHIGPTAGVRAGPVIHSSLWNNSFLRAWITEPINYITKSKMFNFLMFPILSSSRSLLHQVLSLGQRILIQDFRKCRTGRKKCSKYTQKTDIKIFLTSLAFCHNISNWVSKGLLFQDCPFHS